MFKVIRSGFLVVVYYESRKRVFFYTLFVYYESIKREPKIRGIYTFLVGPIRGARELFFF
jgi:hypothetical protein